MMGRALLARTQLTRLLQILMALRGQQCPNARQLAELCEVSPRTIYRDIETLATAGIRVGFCPARQGYRLGPGSGIDLPALGRAEAMALVALVRSCPGAEQIGLRSLGWSGLLKVIQAVDEPDRSLVLGLADRVERPVGDENWGRGASAADLASLLERLLPAVGQGAVLRIWSRGPGLARETARTFGSPTLRLEGSEWFLHGLRPPRNEPESLPLRYITRIEALANEDEPANGIRPLVKPEEEPTLVRLRPSPSALAQVVTTAPLEGIRWWREADGRLLIEGACRAPDELVAWVLGFAAELELLSPRCLRNRLKEAAERIARRHQGVAAIGADARAAETLGTPSSERAS